MGLPGSNGQQTIVLKNQAMSPTAIKGQRAGGSDPGISHVCEGGVCSMVTECRWLEGWRRAQAATPSDDPPAPPPPPRDTLTLDLFGGRR